MDYSNPQLADRLASEYVIGTLTGGARRRLESLLPAHPTLARAVAAWQQRLMPLTGSVKAVAPSQQVWRGLEARLFNDPRSQAAAWWQRLGLWQLLAGGATFASVTLAVLISLPAPVQPPVLVVLAPNQSTSRFVATVSADGRSLVLKPLDGVTLASDKAFELWAVPPQGNPRSLGLVSASARTTVQRQQLLTGTAAFAISIEPPTGSPTGVPTGPVVAVGKIDS
ncbi:MAG: anti-sigma factor [Leptothrix sp. (in: b-proteobacteria)]